MNPPAQVRMYVDTDSAVISGDLADNTLVTVERGGVPVYTNVPMAAIDHSRKITSVVAGFGLGIVAVLGFSNPLSTPRPSPTP